jgi:hypothetical protein
VNAQPGKDSLTLPHRVGQQAGTGIWPSSTAVEAFRWDVGNVGGAYIDQDLVMGYGQTYNINGWTIQTSTGGTRFTKNSTGRGMFVSIENTYPF